MMTKKKILFFLASLYVILFSLKKSGIYFPFISDYFSDLICIPFSLLLAEVMMSWFPFKAFKIGFWQILVTVLYFTLVFEFWMPSISKNYTSDYFDILSYALGGVTYYYFANGRSLFRKTVQPSEGVLQ